MPMKREERLKKETRKGRAVEPCCMHATGGYGISHMQARCQMLGELPWSEEQARYKYSLTNNLVINNRRATPLNHF